MSLPGDSPKNGDHREGRGFLYANKKRSTPYESSVFRNGAYRSRTGDLLHAMQALSQLS